MVDRLLECGVLGLQRQALGMHLDLHVRAAHLQDRVHGDVAADFKHDPGLHVGLNPGADLKVIGTDGNARER